MWFFLGFFFRIFFYRIFLDEFFLEFFLEEFFLEESGDYPSRGAPSRGTSRHAGLHGTPLIGVTPRPAGTYEAGSPQIGDDSLLPPSLPFLLSSSHQVWCLFFQGLFDCHRLLAVKHTPTLATTDSSAIRCYYCIILEIKVIYK